MIQLHYEERGEGEPLILLHGNGESGAYFVHQMEYFSGKYQVVALDTRGHGQSPRGSAPFTIGQFAEDLKGFLDGMGIERANLLGFSDGGNIAMAFALNYPGRVKRLILNGANLFPGGVKPGVQIPIVIGYGVASLFAGVSQEAKQHAQLLGLMVKEPHIRPEQLRTLTMRTLVIAGTRDLIKESHTRLICENLPNARLSFVEGDHFIANKNPEAFNREVERFLNEA